MIKQEDDSVTLEYFAAMVARGFDEQRKYVDMRFSQIENRFLALEVQSSRPRENSTG